MKIHEYQAKEIFARYGIPVPQGSVATSPGEARQATKRLGGQAVLKAQVHAGGRGKADGIKVVKSPEEAEKVARSWLGHTLVTHQTGPEGIPISAVLVEQLADIQKELYVAMTLDRAHRGPVILASAAGGLDIEEVAATDPLAIHSEPIEPVLGLMLFQGRRLAAKLHLDPSLVPKASQIMSAVYRVFIENDCSLVEINPLIVTGEGKLMALDAKINVDDAALFRHKDLQGLRDRSQEEALEAQAADLDIAYVRLDGDVGCLVNGAGLAMATLDVTRAAGAAPANFLDVGGGASEEKVASAVGIMLSDPKVNRVLVNIFGGILRCDIAASGVVVAFQKKNCQLPLVVRMLGTNVEQGKAVLGDSGLNVAFADTLSDVARAIAGPPPER